MTTAPALLLVGHGTRDDAEAEEFRSFVTGLGERYADVPVAGGFVELAEPPLTEAVAQLVRRDVRHVAAVPLTLVPAGTSEGDIPAALALEERRHPGTRFAHGRPLGPHPALLNVLERRLEEALDTARLRTPGGARARTPRDRAETTVLLVGRGSTDPDANAEVHKAARLLWEGRGFAGVEPAFVSYAAPDVPAGLDRCRTLGARRIVVLPYFLFGGVLPDRILAQAEGWAAVHPETEVVASDVLGATEELADLVMERYREVLAGDSPVNFGSCTCRR